MLASLTSVEPIEAIEIHDILAQLPHRYPFVMVDRVLSFIQGERIQGLKNVTINEPYFVGHFPNNPIMPGVLQLEALAQLAGILIAKSPEGFGKLGLFTGMNNVKFRRKVIPGDQLILEATAQRSRFPVYKFSVRALVDGEVSVEGELSITMVEKPASVS